MDFPDPSDYTLKFNQLSEKLIGVSERMLEEYCYDMIAEPTIWGTCLLLNYGTDGIENFRYLLKQIRSKMISENEFNEEIYVTIGIGYETTEPQELYRAVRSAQNAVMNRLRLGNNRLIGVLQMTDEPETDIPLSSLRTDFKKVFWEKIEMYDMNGVEKILNELKEVCIKNEEIDGRCLFSICNEILDLFSFALQQEQGMPSSKEEREEFLQEFPKCLTIEDVFVCLICLITDRMQRRISQGYERELQPIVDAKEYILKHYRESVTLDDISRYVGFNATYFSTMFRQKTGETLTEYIQRVRMERSKEILRNSEVRIADIPELVGIGDAKYFSKQFKRVYGVTPSKYRKLLG
ncbi:MAG: helix-turn-helix domain-containing protein [Lachnospiraceae bacterium]